MSSQHAIQALIHPQGIAFMMEEPSSNHIFLKKIAFCRDYVSYSLFKLISFHSKYTKITIFHVSIQLKLRHTYKVTYLYLYSVVNIDYKC